MHNTGTEPATIRSLARPSNQVSYAVANIINTSITFPNTQQFLKLNLYNLKSATVIHQYFKHVLSLFILFISRKVYASPNFHPIVAENLYYIEKRRKIWYPSLAAQFGNQFCFNFSVNYLRQGFPNWSA